MTKLFVGGPETFEEEFPIFGEILYLHNGEASCLEKIRFLGRTGDHFDQYPMFRWIWLAGPDKGRTCIGYGRGFYRKRKARGT